MYQFINKYASRSILIYFGNLSLFYILYIPEHLNVIHGFYTFTSDIQKTSNKNSKTRQFKSVRVFCSSIIFSRKCVCPFAQKRQLYVFVKYKDNRHIVSDVQNNGKDNLSTTQRLYW